MNPGQQAVAVFDAADLTTPLYVVCEKCSWEIGHQAVGEDALVTALTLRTFEALKNMRPEGTCQRCYCRFKGGIWFDTNEQLIASIKAGDQEEYDFYFPRHDAKVEQMTKIEFAMFMAAVAVIFFFLFFLA